MIAEEGWGGELGNGNEGGDGGGNGPWDLPQGELVGVRGTETESRTGTGTGIGTELGNDRHTHSSSLSSPSLSSSSSSTSTSSSTSFLLTLTVITGQNLANKKNLESTRSSDPRSLEYRSKYNERTSENNNYENNNFEDDSDTTSKAFTLTEEVQRVLIDDFFPPISSSTVPGNPGRLIITLCGDNSDFNN